MKTDLSTLGGLLGTMTVIGAAMLLGDGGGRFFDPMSFLLVLGGTLTAVIAPEILMVQGELIDTFMDARLPAVLFASAYYFWRRGILGTILVGMAVYLPLHIGWGW